ncbi:MAG: oligopeptide ABC transporter permease OppB [Anaerolineae bacterium]|nr:MAG: oligopeptide ABC transporter permease OppB [Anaerolineae bacterium]
MVRYIIRRLLSFIPVLFAISLVIFMMARALPGGPFDFAGDRTIPASVVANLEQKYHLDWPVWRQYLAWVWDALRGDLGPSFYYRSLTVNDLLKQTLPTSFQLGVLSLGLALIIGIPAGTIAALKHNKAADHASSFVAIMGVSIPNIVLAPLLIYIFAVLLGWLPAARWGADYTDYALGFIPPLNRQFWEHAIMPVLVLGTALTAVIARLTRGSLLQVLREDYIRTARAKGLREKSVVGIHAMKNAIIPVITILGPLFAAIVTGTFVIEQIFGINGMGQHFIDSINNRDYPVVMGTLLVYSVILVVANLFVDIAYAWLDPRIRYE